MGLPALQLPSLAKWDALPKGDLSSTCLFKESIPAIPVRNSKHPLPGRSNFLTAAAGSTCSALWLHHAHLFVAAAEKKPSHAEKRGRTCWGIFQSPMVPCDHCRTLNSFGDWEKQLPDSGSTLHPLCIRVARESPLQFPLQNGWSRVKNKMDIHLVLRVGGVGPPHFVDRPYSQNSMSFYRALLLRLIRN